MPEPMSGDELASIRARDATYRNLDGASTAVIDRRVLLDWVDRLRARCERLEGALKSLVKNVSIGCPCAICDEARAALEKGKHE